jgi:regulator of RNase E activity RraA
MTSAPAPLPGSAQISDALDALGLTGRSLPAGIRPLRPGWRIAGPAFPMHATRDIGEGNRRSEGLVRAVDAIPGGAIVLVHSAGVQCAAWGDLASTAATVRGAAGVVCTGPVRDSNSLRHGNLPTFAAERLPVRALGRADIDTFGTPIDVFGVTVHCGDFVIADDDGVVIVPGEAMEAALEQARSIMSRERQIREALSSGMPLGEAVRQPFLGVAGR